MAHEVTLKLHTNVVAHKDIEVAVWENSGKLGTLLISKGNLEWRPAYKSVKRHRLTWSKFAEFMEGTGKPVGRKDGL